MSTVLPSTSASCGQEFPDLAFGRSSDGFPVARVGETAFAMLPDAGDRHYLATGWNLSRSLDLWSRGDFYGHSGELADEQAFRKKVLESAEHQRERKALGRREIRSNARTPWGTSQGATFYAEGIECHSTAGHGGFKLSAERNRSVHPLLRVRGGWYEEDCAWAIVAFTFPGQFTGYERRCADQTIRDHWPDAFEAITGTILVPGQSHEKDRRAFEAAHIEDWIVVSAINSGHHRGFVECVARRGGVRGNAAGEQRFLVLGEEYEIGRFGFVIDPERHAAYDGPSSFIGWQTRGA